MDLKGEDEEHVLKYLNILPFPTLRAKVYVAEGEEGVIRPGDILTIEATLQYEQYVKKSEEEESEGEEKKEEDKEIEEDSLDAQLVNPDEDDADKPEFVDATSHNLRVYAPHFPHDRNDQWWIVVIERQGATPATKVAKKGAVNRKKMKGVDKRAKKIEKMERTERVVICERFDLKEPYVRKVMQIRPSTLIAGERVFEVHVRSAAYFGLDPPPVLASYVVFELPFCCINETYACSALVPGSPLIVQRCPRMRKMTVGRRAKMPGRKIAMTKAKKARSKEKGITSTTLMRISTLMRSDALDYRLCCIHFVEKPLVRPSIQYNVFLRFPPHFM